MADKKCPKCNAVNPGGDEIHYCGMCGVPLEAYEDNTPMEYTVVKSREYNKMIDDEMKRLLEKIFLQARVDDSSLSSKVRKWWTNKD